MLCGQRDALDLDLVGDGGDLTEKTMRDHGTVPLVVGLLCDGGRGLWDWDHSIHVLLLFTREVGYADTTRPPVGRTDGRCAGIE